MSDNPKEVEKKMEKAIFISADCWLKVFDLLPPSQLGLGIALISHRFDYYVDEHFKTRKWTLDQMEIRSKIGKNGAKEMKIINYNDKTLPIPQKPLPNKIMAFNYLLITYFDHNVLTFLRRFHRFFSFCTTQIDIYARNFRILEFAILNIWPMFKDTICQLFLNSVALHHMRQLAPSMLNDCPSLCVVKFIDGIFPAFPPDDSANASDSQALAKWLLTPRADNLPKVLIYFVDSTAMVQWSATVEQIKAAFSNASSSVSFRISFDFAPFIPLSSVVTFELTNELTGEQLTLSKVDENSFLLIRCPIVYDEAKWGKALYERLIDGENKIEIWLEDKEVENDLLDAASAGPSGDH